MTEKAVVLHSGGMDSSLCLCLAIQKFGAEHVVSLGFDYKQRHASELAAAAKIADHFSVRRVVIELPVLPGWCESSLVNHAIPISTSPFHCPNSFVPGRNGLFLMMAALFAKEVAARTLYIGVMELEGRNSGYPDCSKAYVDLVQTVIRHDLQDPGFTICTPLVSMTKVETLMLAHSLGVVSYLLDHTVTCYNGIPLNGCQQCPACVLRNEGVAEFQRHSHCVPRPV